jgi:hypothetical protein
VVYMTLRMNPLSREKKRVVVNDKQVKDSVIDR